jgi:ATP-dependent Lon protease
MEPNSTKKTLPLIPLDDVVVFPGMNLTLGLDAGDEEEVLLVPRSGEEFAAVGTVARVDEQVRLPGGARATGFEGLHRGVAGAARTDLNGTLRIEVTPWEDPADRDEEIRGLEREYRAVVEEILELRQAGDGIRAFLRSISEPGALADTAGYSPDLTYEQKVELLETLDVREQAERELGRLERMGDGSGESSMLRTYLDWLIAVPWGERSDERLDPVGAREVLDADHAGLEDVKERITVYIAVRKLRAERGVADDGKAAGAILTLIGPPGTGKTSIGESIARATGREFVRMSLGGIHDEAEIRGHRRTYIGALPGRLVRALRDAETMNPVIMLDEVDKVGADWRGDPSSALLEVLDPAQNHSFRDHYLDVELDLSEVLFIATANVAETIPGPLLDRMEVVGFDGYTTDEKVAIARGYLWPRQLERNGLEAGEVEIGDDVLRTIVTEYTREAGVRGLERELGKVLRKTATRIAGGEADGAVTIDADGVRKALGRQRHFQEAAERTALPGVATGLSVTGAGGDVLFIETTSMDGKDDFVLTGQLGDVMKESARIALSYVRGHADALGIDRAALEGREFHVHVPAGAIPKDGPSAGITITTALTSLLTGRPVKHTVGMTGEVTLQGRVLPIGGLKQKVLAAHAAGLTDVVIPERNRGDLEDVPEEVREEMRFHPVFTVDEVLEIALEPDRVPAVA